MKLTLLLLLLPLLGLAQVPQTTKAYLIPDGDKPHSIYKIKADTTKAISYMVDPGQDFFLIERSNGKRIKMTITWGESTPPVVTPPTEPSNITIEAEAYITSSGMNKNGVSYVISTVNAWAGFGEIDFGNIDHKKISFKYATADEPDTQVTLRFGSPTSAPIKTFTLSPKTGGWFTFKQSAEFDLPAGVNGKKLMFLTFSRGFHLDSITIK